MQGEILHKRGVESGRYTEAWRVGEDMTDGRTGRGKRKEWRSELGHCTYWHIHTGRDPVGTERNFTWKRNDIVGL